MACTNPILPSEAELISWLENLDFASGQPLGQSNQGEVRRFRFKGKDLAIKAPNGHGLLRWLRLQSLRREYRTYLQLQGLSGFAHCHGLFADRYLVLDYISGADFRHAELTDQDAFFRQLLEVIQAMHGRGVAHGDLKRKDNLRVSTNGQAVILDLGTAVRRKTDGGPLNRRLFEFIRQTDLNAWVKLKYGRYEAVAPEDQHYLRRSGLERALSQWWPGRR
jgi:serine/threonine protein kinase